MWKKSPCPTAPRTYKPDDSCDLVYEYRVSANWLDLLLLQIYAPGVLNKIKRGIGIKLLFRGLGDDRGANLHRSAGGALPTDCGTVWPRP